MIYQLVNFVNKINHIFTVKDYNFTKLKNSPRCKIEKYKIKYLELKRLLNPNKIYL